MTMNFEAARRQMLDHQVRAWDVLDDRVLEAMASVPRERYAPPAFREVCFGDTPIPLAHGQCMLAPSLEGRLLQALEITRGDAVLEVGTGSGFLAACLALLSGNVRSIDLFDDFVSAANARFETDGITGVVAECADAMQLADVDRYDAIAVTGSLPVYDARFERALKVGGRLFVIVGEAPAMEARLVTRTGPAEWLTESLFETSVPALLHASQPSRFVF